MILRSCVARDQRSQVVAAQPACLAATRLDGDFPPAASADPDSVVDANSRRARRPRWSGRPSPRPPAAAASRAARSNPSSSSGTAMAASCPRSRSVVPSVLDTLHPTSSGPARTPAAEDAGALPWKMRLSAAERANRLAPSRTHALGRLLLHRWVSVRPARPGALASSGWGCTHRDCGRARDCARWGCPLASLKVSTVPRTVTPHNGITDLAKAQTLSHS